MSNSTTSAATASPVPAPGSLWTAGFFALGTFAIGTEGFMIAPLLPRMAADFAMSVPAVASLVVAFTLALAISSPLATMVAARWNRRDTLLGAMALFTVSNLAAALSGGFASLMVARLVMALASGLFVPNANALAGAIVGPERRGRALAIVSGGMTIAIALGLPLGSVVGHAFGWRATFLAVAVMGAIALLGIVAGVPRQAGAHLPVATLQQRLAVIGQPAVRRLLGVTLLWAIGAYSAYPYIAAYLAAVLGYGDTGVGATVSLWGACAALGVIGGGMLTDRIGASVVVRRALALLVLAFWSLAALAVAASGGMRPQLAVLLAVAVWGVMVWAVYPAQLARLIGAGQAAQAPVALSLNTSTMYLGFSLGSAAGAAILGSGAIWGIGLFAGTATVLAYWLDRRHHA